MDYEPIFRANLLALATAYAKATGVKLSTVSRFSHGDPPFYDNLAKGKPSGFTIRKYDSALQWFRANWPEGAAWPDIWEPVPPATPVVTPPRARRRRSR